MKRLRPEKLLTIISTAALAETLTNILCRDGVTGYTVLEASGGGSTGLQTGMLDSDSNILLHVVLPEEMVSTVLDDLERLMSRGHRLKVLVSDVAVLTLKSSGPVPHAQ